MPASAEVRGNDIVITFGEEQNNRVLVFPVAYSLYAYLSELKENDSSFADIQGLDSVLDGLELSNRLVDAVMSGDSNLTRTSRKIQEVLSGISG